MEEGVWGEQGRMASLSSEGEEQGVSTGMDLRVFELLRV